MNYTIFSVNSALKSYLPPRDHKTRSIMPRPSYLDAPPIELFLKPRSLSSPFTSLLLPISTHSSHIHSSYATTATISLPSLLYIPPRRPYTTRRKRTIQNTMLLHRETSLLRSPIPLSSHIDTEILWSGLQILVFSI
jgi:hypothetical protein